MIKKASPRSVFTMQEPTQAIVFLLFYSKTNKNLSEKTPLKRL